MSRYIDADAVVWEIEKDKCGLEDCDSALDVAIAEIKTFKTADVVEVVRCKDCKHNHEHETPMGNKFHICNINKLAFTQYADFYCAYGERK